MAMLASAALSAGAQVGGGIMSAGGAAAQNETTRQNNAQMQANYQRTREDNMYYFEENWRRQQYNADSTYQRAMNDMRAAGLNPILAYQKGGNPVPSPVGASGASGPSLQSLPANPQGELGRGLSNAVSSALNAATTVQNLQAVNANVKKTEAETSLTKTNELKAVAETDYTKNKNLNPEVERDVMRAQENLARQAAATSGAQAGLFNEQRETVASDNRRKAGYGDSWLGNPVDSVVQILKQLWNSDTVRANRWGGGGSATSPRDTSRVNPGQRQEGPLYFGKPVIEGR